jgi:hypothetical protein
MNNLDAQTALAADLGRVIRHTTWHARQRVDWPLHFRTAAAMMAVVAIIAAGAFWLRLRVGDDRLDTARIDVPGVFGSLPAGDAAEWAALARDNPPPHALFKAGRAGRQGERTTADIAVWTSPAPRPTPGVH